LVLSRPAALRLLRTAVVAPITTTIRGVPSEVIVGVEDGLKTESAVNLDHLYTVAQSDMRQWLARLDERRMAEVCMALTTAMGCT
jgi:mRNA interferase MazF